MESCKMKIETLDNSVKTMSSLEIAALTGKEHFHVLRDIDAMLAELGEDVLSFKYIYLDSMNREQREFILPKELADLLLQKYQGLARVPHRLQEEAALKTLEQVLGIQLIRQYRVLSFRIDGYDAKANVAYEIDEPGHRSSKAKDAERQKRIEATLGCTFVRINL